MAPPSAFLLASLAPLVLEFDPEQWQAWQQFSTNHEDENPNNDLLTKLVKAYREDPSERISVLDSSGLKSGRSLAKSLTR